MNLVDTTRCPICGQLNQCAMEIEKATGLPQEACWCVSVDFTAQVLSQVPPEKQRLACICQQCAQQSHTTATGQITALDDPL